MSTAILRPVADGDLLELTPSTGTAHYALVDEATADDNDYLQCPAAYSKSDRFTLGTLSLPTGSVITQIAVTVRGKDVSSSGSSGVVYLRVGTVNKNIGNVSFTTTIGDKTITRRTNPHTGQAFTVSDLSGATIQVYISSGAVSGDTRVSQIYLTVTYIAGGSSSLIIRPNADKSAAALSIQPASPTTRYDKIDEATEDTSDYVYVPSSSSSTATFDMETASGSGVISHLVIHAKVQAITGITSNSAGIDINQAGAPPEPLSLPDLNEREITMVRETNLLTGVAWTWSDIATIYATLSLAAGSGNNTRCYQLWIEIFYTPPVYFDGIVCNSVGNGYAAVSGVLRSDASTPAYKRAQVASDSGFTTILGDSTELAATETPGNPMVITFSWTPASAGTYYARLGVRASGEAVLTWITLTFTVTFPTVSGISVAQTGEHATITVTITDNYMDPPEVTIFIDGQAVKGNLN